MRIPVRPPEVRIARSGRFYVSAIWIGPDRYPVTFYLYPSGRWLTSAIYYKAVDDVVTKHSAYYETALAAKFAAELYPEPSDEELRNAGRSEPWTK